MGIPTIILEDAKFIWTTTEKKECSELYKSGLNVFEIAERMGENPDDVALLIIHLGQKGKL